MTGEIFINLKEILNKRGMEQKQLAEMTGLTERTISELCNNKVERIPKAAITKIIKALEIDDISEIIKIKKKDAE